MKNMYLKKQINKYDRHNQILMSVVLIFGILIGRYFFYNDSRNMISGSIVGLFGAIIFSLIERNVRAKYNLEKGEKFESLVIKKLESIGFSCERNISTGNGDLDILAVKNNTYYGIEAKNISGPIVYSKETLQCNDHSLNESLDRLLGNCEFVRNKKYGISSKVFIKPVVIFGYNATLLSIPREGVVYKGNTIKVISIKDLNKDLV